jgi:hypothetical protein
VLGRRPAAGWRCDMDDDAGIDTHRTPVLHWGVSAGCVNIQPTVTDLS